MSGDSSRDQCLNHERRILLCVTGLSPQVVTETFYVLATQANQFIPTEVHVITTTEGARRIRQTLLDASPQEQYFYRLCIDLDIDPDGILFDTSTIHQIPMLSSPKNERQETDGNTLLDDIRSVEDNEAAANAITEVVRNLTADSTSAIHASIAGGRKTMGFYLGYAMSLFGREQDGLSHVLVSAPFESHPQFYYPPKPPQKLQDRNGQTIDTNSASITLADIPFVRLRGHLDNSILGESKGYSETVASTQSNVNPPELFLDYGGKRLVCGGRPVILPPSLLAFYAWFVQRLLAGNAGIHWSQQGVAEEYLEEYASVVGEFSGDYEQTCTSLKRGMDDQFYDPKISKINKRIENALGKEPARPYLLGNIGMIPDSRYRLKGLMLKPHQARFL